MPLLEGPIISKNGGAAKPPLQFTLYLPLLGGAYFGQISCVKNQSKNQTNEIVHAELYHLVYLPLLTIPLPLALARWAVGGDLAGCWQVGVPCPHLGSLLQVALSLQIRLKSSKPPQM